MAYLLTRVAAKDLFDESDVAEPSYGCYGGRGQTVQARALIARVTPSITLSNEIASLARVAFD